MQSSYQPISCSFYDLFEHYAVMGKPVRLDFLDEQGSSHTLTERIRTTRTTGEGEFLVLFSGTEIRMDRVLAIEGEAAPGMCQIL